MSLDCDQFELAARSSTVATGSNHCGQYVPLVHIKVHAGGGSMYFRSSLICELGVKDMFRPLCILGQNCMVHGIILC